MNCATCGGVLKSYPAGNAKATGKPYAAFTKCPKDCYQPRTVADHYQKPVAAAPDWDKINAEKEGSIRWCNALNNACLLVTKSVVAPDMAALQQKIVQLANFIYLLEPAPKPAPLPSLPVPTAAPVDQVQPGVLPEGSEMCSKGCGAEVRDAVLDFSMNRLGAPICLPCQSIK